MQQSAYFTGFVINYSCLENSSVMNFLEKESQLDYVMHVILFKCTSHLI